MRGTEADIGPSNESVLSKREKKGKLLDILRVPRVMFGGALFVETRDITIRISLNPSNSFERSKAKLNRQPKTC